jgi:hypothetical protein
MPRPVRTPPVDIWPIDDRTGRGEPPRLARTGDTDKCAGPPARVWGCPTAAMWVYRLGDEKAKRMLLTGGLVTGADAKDMGLLLDAVPEQDFDAPSTGSRRASRC